MYMTSLFQPSFISFIFDVLQNKLLSLENKQAVKFIDKRQNVAIFELSPLLHGLSEDISC